LKRLLMVAHKVSPASEVVVEALRQGACDPQLGSQVGLILRPALTASAFEALEADAYLLFSPVNLGYMSGALKHFFDQIYYPCLGPTKGRLYGACFLASGDASGACRALESIVTGLGWRAMAPPLVVFSPPSTKALAQARELGATLAASLTL